MLKFDWFGETGSVWETHLSSRRQRKRNLKTGHFTKAGAGGNIINHPPPIYVRWLVTSAGLYKSRSVGTDPEDPPTRRQTDRQVMKMVSSSRLRCLLLLLLSLTASISCSSAAQRDSKLRLLLHRTPLLGSKQVRTPHRQTETFL